MASPPEPTRKTIFLLRHGRSTWNEAQASQTVSGKAGMLDRDHPLNGEGIEQCDGFHAIWSVAAAQWAKSEGAGGAGGVESTTAGTLAKGPIPAETAAAGQGGDHDHEPAEAAAHASTRGKESKLHESKLDFENRFLQAEKVYTSPMTRAVQTAMVCLQGHYASESSGIECMSAAREIKGLGGMDCIGKVVGDEIVTRALDEMEKINGPEFAAQYTSELGVGDCSEQWWTNVKDTKSSLEDRCELFWSTLEANPASDIIVTTHSNFVRQLMSGVTTADDSSQELKQLVATAAEFKLNNASCLAIDCLLSGPNSPAVVNASLVFDSSFSTEVEQAASQVAKDAAIKAASGMVSGIRSGVSMLSTTLNTKSPYNPFGRDKKGPNDNHN